MKSGRPRAQWRSRSRSVSEGSETTTAKQIARVQLGSSRYRVRAQGLPRRFGIFPVAAHQVGPAHHQFADRSGRNRTVLLIHDCNLRIGNGLADRSVLPVELGRVEIGCARAFGEPVHAIEQHTRKELAQPIHVRWRQGSGGVGEIAQCRQRSRLQFLHGKQHGGDGRHQRHACHTFRPRLFEHRMREGEIALQHQMRACAHADKKLVEAVGEGKRQRAQHHVPGTVFHVKFD